MIFDWIMKIFGYLWVAATVLAYAALFGAVGGIVYGVLSTGFTI